MLILVWGLPDESPIATVARALSDAGANYALLDQRKVLDTRIRLSVGERVSGRITLGNLNVDLEEVASAYIRPYESRQFTSIRDSLHPEKNKARAAAVDEPLLNWCDLSPAMVLNRPRHMASNNSKPYQARVIQKFGFRVPDTLITTSLEAANEFRQRHESVIYKSASGTRSRVTRLTSAHGQRFSDIACCPTQFQEFVPGRDFRAHVVGPDLFTSELHCDADDYRYPGDHTLAIGSATLPPEIEAQCIRLAFALNLPLAGIDLRRTPDGEWFCFEVNPSPAFTFYQDATGQPIAAAIASLLMTRCPATESFAIPAFVARPTLFAMDPAAMLAPVAFWES